MDIKFQDKIDNYLLNRMSIEERHIFEQELEANAELKEQLEFSRLVQAAIKDRGDKLSQIAKWEQEEPEQLIELEDEQSNTVVPVKSWRKYLYWRSGIAAVFVVGFFIFSTMKYSSNDGGSFGSPSDGDSYGNVYRGGSANNSKIMEMLEKGDYHDALALIENEEAEVRHELDLLYDNARDNKIDDTEDKPNVQQSVPKSSKKPEIVTSAEDEIYDTSAAEDFEYEKEIIEDELHRLQWLKAIALKGCDKKEEALSVLNDLRKIKGEYQLKADSLYKELKNEK